MHNFVGFRVSLALLFLCLPSSGQTPGKSDSSNQDVSKEGAVIEQMTTTATFESDGNNTREQHTRVRIQSDAGVQQYGLLRFPYQASFERVQILSVRVTNTHGVVLDTPLDSVQDVTSEIYREAPLYSDLREKHVPVRGLEPGYTLEYFVRWKTDKPLAKGQFWIGYQFLKNQVVLDEQLEISVPREREVKLKSQTLQPRTREEDDRRIYTWKTSNLASRSIEKQREDQDYDLNRGLLPPPDVLLSSFRTWEEVGQWYENLEQEKIAPSPEVRAKAEELTAGLSDDDAKIRAIYNYVSLRYRYIAISFGVGRYQPHTAKEILGNQYGDCKDKHTLLASLLGVVGIGSYPALINSRAAVEPDVPSPAQFDHVISVVQRGGVLSWMDTTPEVTPLGHLVLPLRSKPALVIIPGKIAFQTTPATPLFGNRFEAKLTAKIENDDTLHGHAEVTTRGDYELYSRYAFRRVPESQWKELEQSNSYAAHLGATISNVRATSPENTGEPFTEAYDYTLRDFAGGDKRQFVIPLASPLPAVKDEDLKRTSPLWLGYIGEAFYEARIELPKGLSATPLPPMDLKESFAEFQDKSEVIDGVLICRRHLLLRANAVGPDQLVTYKKFQKSVHDRWAAYIYLVASSALTSFRAATTPAEAFARVGELLRQSMVQLPASSNQGAVREEQNARSLLQSKDVNSAIASLKQAVSLDASFTRAWIELGTAYYAGNRDASSGLEAFRKAVDADPQQIIPYKILAFVEMGLSNRNDAIATWQRLQAIAPADTDMEANLGSLYITQKRYAEASALFEAEIKRNPSNAIAEMSLGVVDLRSGHSDQGFTLLNKALEIDSSALMLNNIAYELAESGTHLSDALSYSQQAVKEVEFRSQKASLGNIETTDRLLPVTVSAYWDTIGWIYFKMGDLERAENYLNSAWQLGQEGPVGDHLGQVYEKQHKLPAALHMYNLALRANPRMDETQSRIRNLSQVPFPKNGADAGAELSQMRTVRLPPIVKESASADFYVLIVGGSIQDASFISGAESLRPATDFLRKASFREPLPSGSAVHLVRRGIVSCSSYSGCSFVFYPLYVASTMK